LAFGALFYFTLTGDPDAEGMLSREHLSFYKWQAISQGGIFLIALLLRIRYT